MKILFVILLMIPLYAHSQGAYDLIGDNEDAVRQLIFEPSFTVTKSYDTSKPHTWDYVIRSVSPDKSLATGIFFKDGTSIQVCIICKDKYVIESYAETYDKNSYHESRNVWYTTHNGKKYRIQLREDAFGTSYNELVIRLDVIP